MRLKLLLFYMCLFIWGQTTAQLSIQSNGITQTIDFDSSVSGVTEPFNGTGLALNPATGQLDADAWAVSGMSDGSQTFGQANTSGDFARGSSSGGVSTGGLYAFEVAGVNTALGIQPTGSDWTGGNITLKITNNGSDIINNVDVAYNAYIRNDQGRSNSLRFYFSVDNVSYQEAPALSITSAATADGSPAWVQYPKSTTLVNLGIPAGSSLYVRWLGNDVGGSGSRDEFAIDDIAITAAGSVGPCTEPTAQGSTLSFGTLTSNAIQGSFTTSDANKYLVLISTSNSLSANPADGVVYSSGNIIGNAEVVQYGVSNSFSAGGLTSLTTYYFYIFGANDNCEGGPDYYTINPLSGSASTLEDGNTGFYSSIGTETCADLKTALYNLITNHTTVSYAALWTHYQTTDTRLNDAGNATIVWDMYSDNPAGSETEFTFVTDQCGTFAGEGSCYNREHSFPKSYWGGSTSNPMYTDMYVVIPVDGWINSVRNNHPYSEVAPGTESQITTNGSKAGASEITIPGYSGTVFEPIDAYKGDLARNYFYMATRYEDQIASWETFTAEGNSFMDGTSFPCYEPWFLNMLLSWNQLDPVSQKEIDRNEAVYAIQGNRNPFIDHPEYVGLIWGDCSGGSDVQAPSAPLNLAAANITETSADLSWSASSDNVGVTGYRVYQDGLLVATPLGTGTTIAGLTAATSYDFQVSAVDAAGNQSSLSSILIVTTNSGTDTQAPTTPLNLAGTNITETSVDLSWSASSDNVGVTGYRIYQDGILVGTPAGTSTTVNSLSPATSYGFRVSAVDAAGNESGLSSNLGITTATPADTQAPTTPLNLAGTNVTETSVDLSWSASSDNVGVTGYNVYQGGVLAATTGATAITINGLTASTNYVFQVSALDAAGNESALTSNLGITTATPPGGPTVLHEGYFESGWDGWADGGNDCARYSGGNSFEGSYSIRLRDNSGTSSAMTSPVFDLSTYGTVSIEFSFYVRSFERVEDFWVLYYDGSGWNNIATYVNGTDIANGNFYTKTITLNNGAYNFAANAQFRFQCDASGNNDQIFVDAVTVSADGQARIQQTPNLVETQIRNNDQENTWKQELNIVNETFEVYPNPATDRINLDVNGISAGVKQLAIYNLQGSLMKIITPQDNLISNDISAYKSGMYMIQLVDNNDKIFVRRFIVK